MATNSGSGNLCISKFPPILLNKLFSSCYCAFLLEMFCFDLDYLQSIYVHQQITSYNINLNTGKKFDLPRKKAYMKYVLSSNL